MLVWKVYCALDKGLKELAEHLARDWDNDSVNLVPSQLYNF